MQTPGNLPSTIPTISAFAGDLLRIVFIFPESFDMSGLSFALTGSFPTETEVVGSNFTVSIAPDVTKKLPVVVDYYLVKAGKHILKGKIKPSKGSGTSDPTVFRITQTADVIFAVQVDSLEVVAQLTEKLQEVLTAATQVSEDKQTVSSDKTDVLEAKEDVVNARNEVLQTQVSTVDDLTFPYTKRGFIYAALDTNFSDTPKMQIYYNDGTALTKGDLWTWPAEQLKNLI